MTTKKYILPALPERTVVRIPIGGKIMSMQALLKETKKLQVPATAKLRLLRTPEGTAARFEYPTSLAVV